MASPPPATADVSAGAHEGINRWVALFSAACRREVDDAAAFEPRVERIHEQWLATLGRTRAGSAAERLLTTLLGAPVVSVSSAPNLIGRSFQATNEAMKWLEAAGIVRQVNVGRRNRAFEAPAVIDAFTALERQLASPGGGDPVCTTPPPDASATTVTRIGAVPTRRATWGTQAPGPSRGAGLMMLAPLPQVRRQGCALPASGRP
jgi:hypothetical protein